MPEESRDVEKRDQPSLRESFRFGESVETSLEIVDDSPTLQSLLRVIGLCLGGSAGSIFAEWAIASLAQREKERLTEFVELLASRLETLEGQAVRQDFFATELGHDMLLKALDESRRTRSKLKKELFVRILKGAVIDAEKREYSPEEYLYLITDLTEQDIRIGLSLYKERPGIDVGEETRAKYWQSWEKKIRSETGLDVRDLRFTLARLVASGLLDRVDYLAEGAYLHVFGVPGEHEIGLHKVTPAFEKMMQLMEME